MTAAIVRRLSSTFPVLRYFGTLPYSLHRQIKSSFARNLWPTAVDLGSQQASIVNDLNRKGYAIIEGYWPRDKALDVGHALEEMVQTAENRSLECGATIRVNFRRRPGGGIRRIYDVDKFMPELRAVRYDRSHLDVAAGYYGVSFTSKALIYQFDSLIGSTDGPWHFDTFYPEMKALLFLQDVNERCGPTAYIKGSHRLHGFRLRNEWFGYRRNRQPRFFEAADLATWLDHEVLLCGSAGTLILFDSRGLHRTTAQNGSTRSLLMNYLVLSY